MAPIVKLIHGKDVLDLNSGRYCVEESSFAPPSTSAQPVFGRSTYGSDYISTRPVNREWGFQVNIDGASQQEAERALRDIRSFLTRAGGIAEPVYLAFRGYNDYDFEPYFGTFGAFARYEVVYGTAEASQYYPAADSGLILKVSVSLVIKPYAVGLEQRVGQAKGSIFEDFIGTTDGQPRGTIIGANGNLLTNPIFSAPTFSTGWSVAGTGGVMAKNTNSEFVLFGAASVRLSFVSGGAAFTFTQSYTPVVSQYTHLSAYIKMEDSSSVQTADIRVVLEGTVVSTSYTNVGNGWWRIYGSATAAAGLPETYGIINFGGTQTIPFYVGGVQMTNDEHYPFCYGDLVGCAWASTKATTATTAATPYLRYNFSDFLSARTNYTIRIVWNPPVSRGTLTRYFLEDSNDDIAVYMDTSERIVARSKSTASATSSVLTVTPHTPMVFHITFNGATIVIYSAGAQVGTAAGTGASTVPTYVYVGTDDASATPCYGTLQDVTTFRNAMTAAQVLADYNAVYQMAADGQRTGALPYIWTEDGDGVIDNENDSTDDFNYAIISGLLGDDIEPAFYAKNSATYDTTHGLIWGTLPVDPRLMDKDIFDMTGTNYMLFVNGSGTADANANNGDVERQSQTTAALEYCDTGILPTYALVRGREFYACAVVKDAGSALQMRLKMEFGSELYYSAYRNVTASGAFYLYVLGPLFVPDQPPMLDVEQKFGLAVEGKRTTGTANLDVSHVAYMSNLSFMNGSLLTSPAGADGFFARRRDAYSVYSITSESQTLGRAPLLPRPLYLEGGRQNVLNLHQSADTKTWTRAATVTINKASVKPRWNIY